MLVTFENSAQREWRRKRIEWALETVSVHPTSWSHQWRGSPVSILAEAAKELLASESIVTKTV